MDYLLEDYQKVYQMLKDDESRDIYINRLNALISKDSKFIRHIVTTYLPDIPPLNGKTLKDLLDSMPANRKIILYGAGAYARENLHYWKADKRFIGFCSHTKQKQANGYLGYPVISPQELLACKSYSVVISTTRARNEVLQILRSGGYPEELIFDTASYSWAEDPGQYFSPSFLHYEEKETFVDAGAYHLDSVLRLKTYCKYIKKVYAFEPDDGNYKICLEQKEKNGLSEVEVLPYGTWSKKGILRFQARNSGSSRITENGECNIPVTAIDDVVDPTDKVTFLKMDVEGAELESLKGARRVIQKDKPKLAICIYHKPEDMTEIPLYIKELVPEYQFYIRHHSNSFMETVLYAVIP